MSETTLIRGKIFNPVSPDEWTFFENGALIINAAGRLEAVGDYAILSVQHPEALIKDYSGSLILPGLIDLHTHLPQHSIRGIQAGTLLDWLNHYAFPVEEAFAEAEYARALSDRFFTDLLANGTTTALVLSSVHKDSTHIAFEAAGASGMRIAMGKVMMDQHSPPALQETTEASIADSEWLARTWHGQNNDLLRYAFTPRFALSCSQTVLEAAGDLHRRYPGSYLHSHLSENEKEIEAVTALYDHRYSYTEIYHRSGCLGDHTVMAHGIYLAPEELDLLEATQTRIAHCPTSNFFLKSGFFNLPEFRKRNIPFALGSDVGAGPELSMFSVMRHMDEAQLHHQTGITPMEALYYATLAGANALHLDDETGSLEPGKSADFIVIDLQGFDRLTWDDTPMESLLSQVMYRGGPHCISHTYVRGQARYTQPQPFNGLTHRQPVSI